MNIHMHVHAFSKCFPLFGPSILISKLGGNSALPGIFLVQTLKLVLQTIKNWKAPVEIMFIQTTQKNGREWDFFPFILTT